MSLQIGPNTNIIAQNPEPDSASEVEASGVEPESEARPEPTQLDLMYNDAENTRTTRGRKLMKDKNFVKQ